MKLSKSIKKIQISNSLITLILKYKDQGSPDNKTAVRDILTDVLHYCDEECIDFTEVLEGATEVYNEEKENLS